jgi:hypothetical protein
MPKHRLETVTVTRNVTRRMSHFVKLDSGLLDSSLWVQADARTMFITALLLAHPVELLEPVEAIQIGSLKPLGFTVPAGWYGMVEAASTGLCARACLSPEAGTSALSVLASPDPDSRTPTYEGRRMVRISGGFLILNYMTYRERDYTAAERQRRYRERQKEQRAARDVTRNITQVEVEADGDAEADQKKQKPRSRAAARPEDVPDAVWSDFASLRRQRRAPVTETVVAGIRREAAAAGMSMEQAIRTCVERGWQSFKADWAQAGGKLAPAKQAAHIPNMPLGHASCACAGCTSFRRARAGA